MRWRFIAIALAALVLTASAYADAIFLNGNNPQPNEENVHFFNPEQTGHTVTGVTNQSTTEVNFTSSQILTAKGGQSDVDAATGAIHNVVISLPSGLSFQDLIIDPQKVAADDGITASVHLTDGLNFSDVFGRQHGLPGQNFLTIVATGGEAISSVTLTSTDGFNDLKQTRISGIEGVTVIPEPSSMLLMGSGLLVFTRVLRRKLILSQKHGQWFGVKPPDRN